MYLRIVFLGLSERRYYLGIFFSDLGINYLNLREREYYLRVCFLVIAERGYI